jgi:alpha-1,2-mannosyltransferase
LRRDRRQDPEELIDLRDPVARRSWRGLLTMGLPVASCLALIARLWAESYRTRIDFHIYFATVHRWPARSLYNFDPRYHLGFTYPPFASVVIWPFTRLSESVAEHLWLVGTVAASAAFLLIVCRELPDRPRRWWFTPLVVAVGVWSVPVVFTARLGQINAFLALAVLVDVLLAKRGSRWAGVLTGLAAAIKLTPLAALVYFAAARKWRALITALGTFVAAAAAAAIASPHDTVRYWTTEVFSTKRVGGLGNHWNDSMRRLIAALPIRADSQTMVWILACLVLGFICYVRAVRAHDLGNDLAGITLAMCFGAAASPISWAHHLYFMLPALVLVLGSGRSRWRVAAAIVLVWMLFEVTSPGHNFATNVARAIALPTLVVAMPIDEVRRRSKPIPPPARDPTPGALGLGVAGSD